MQNAVTPAPHAIEAAPRALYVTEEQTPFGLEQHAAAWHQLIDHAAEPNPFFEPPALLGAWRHLAPPAGFHAVLVWAPNVLPGQPPHLVGLFPLVRQERWKGLPIAAAVSWHHLYTYLGTPLVRAELAALVLETLLRWLRERGIALLQWRAIASDGPFAHALIDALHALDLDAARVDGYTRAMFRPASSPDAFLERSISGKKRKELRRQERRLAELGALAYEELGPDGDLDAWIDELVALEATGWKGRAHTALRDDPGALAAFRALARGAFARRRWVALSLRHGGRAIAMKCNLLAAPGAIAYKIAYDETYARFSPGVLLELEQIRRLHEPGAPRWMDSGAAADHPMIGHLWRDRVAIETFVVPTGLARGELATAALPLLRWTSRTVASVARRLRYTNQ